MASVPSVIAADSDENAGVAVGSNPTQLNRARPIFVFRLRGILFTALIALSAIPVLILNGWMERSAMEKEIVSVSEKHLIIAKNLSAALSRYVIDVKAGFMTAAGNPTSDSLRRMLRTLGFKHTYIIDRNDRVSSTLLAGNEGSGQPKVGADLIGQLRDIARAAEGEVIITDLMRDSGQPRLFVVLQVAPGRFAMGALGLEYIRAVQRSVAFGERGHSMIVDAKGIVMAHPNANWERISKNASKLSVVRKMMRGETGVATFYSPPMKADMIAGHTSVPETGWGVMVPQPMSELIERAGDTQKIAIGITVIGILIASIIGWWLANFLSRPIIAVEKAAGAVASGSLSTQVEPLPKYSPLELQSLAANFDRMVDELHHRDQGLRVAMNQAESASRSKTEFLANMSHELRTPLNAIIGFSEMLTRQAFGPLGAERYVEYAGDIHKSGKNLLAVISDVLDVAKIEAGQLTPNVSDVDLRQLARSCLRMIENRAKQGDITVRSDVPEDLPLLRADERMIRQIMLNLLSNAVKFTPKGGMVSLVASCQENGDVSLSVTDTGIGIAPENMDLVVQPFGQVENPMQRSYEGTGLGLFLSKTMVELQGGRQEIISRLGEGTTVSIHFSTPSDGTSPGREKEEFDRLTGYDHRRKR